MDNGSDIKRAQRYPRGRAAIKRSGPTNAVCSL